MENREKLNGIRQGGGKISAKSVEIRDEGGSQREESTFAKNFIDKGTRLDRAAMLLGMSSWRSPRSIPAPVSRIQLGRLDAQPASLMPFNEGAPRLGHFH
jgi:hypothetical protein